MQLMNDNIMVEPFTREDEVTEGGIVIPAMGSHTIRARVVAVGPGKSMGPKLSSDRRPMMVRKTDEVILPAGAGTPVIIEKKQALIVQEDEILAYFRKPVEPEEEE